MDWFRASARHVAATLVVSMLALGGSMAASHPDDCHDAACSLAPLSHDPSAHAVRGAGQDAAGHPLHCLVCHWARSFRPGTEVRFVSTPSIQAGTPVHADIVTVAATTTVAQPPLRSPPQNL